MKNVKSSSDSDHAFQMLTEINVSQLLKCSQFAQI